MKTFLLLIVSMMIFNLGCETQQQKIPVGKGQFIFKEANLCSGLPLTVYTYRPAEFNHDSPVLFVIHGNKRNGSTYRDQWIDIAEKHKALLLAPEFSRENGFPEDMHYNMGNLFVMDSLDNIIGKNPKNDWAFSIIDPIFEYTVDITGNHSKEYLIYGHSAGSQFVHRFLYFIPDAKVGRAVCANAGWYTMPDFDQVYPYGLGRTPCTEKDLQNIYQKNVTVLLAKQDTSTTSSSLRRTPEAMLQGKYRFERGNNFFTASKKMADSINAKFQWQLQTIHDAKHKNVQMKAKAADFLFRSGN
jgi:hypothetical protein